MTEEDAAGRELPRETSDSLSEFGARVLGQLRLSAWLPGATLVATTYVLLVLASVETGEGVPLDEFLQQLNATDLTVVLGLVLVTAVVATMTQAFAFGMIRFFEGYWGFSLLSNVARMPANLLQSWKRRYFAWRLRRLKGREVQSAARARDLSKDFASAMEAVYLGRDVSAYSPEALRRAREPWEGDASPAVAQQRLAVGKRLEEFPRERAFGMPTRLGNSMRAMELAAFPGDRDIHGAVLRRLPFLDSQTRVKHDEARNQLDLYALMIIVSGVMGLLGLVLLEWRPLRIAWLASGVVLAIANYIALLGAARLYGRILKEIGRINPETGERT